MSGKAVEQYLKSYAEAEAALASELFSTSAVSASTTASTSAYKQMSASHTPLFQACLVIPVFAENYHFIERWLTSKIAQDKLLILVLNQHENAAEHQQRMNAELFDWLLEKSCVLQKEKNLFLLRQHHHHFILVDRFRNEFILKQKHGVGHARKIGCDIAARLHHENIVASPWIYSTDADAQLPENYFSLNTPNHSNLDSTTKERLKAEAAQVFDFRHIKQKAQVNEKENELIYRSTQLYESAIKYYRDGLAWAGSPYAFYTLGSTLAVNTNAYCQVRGFPKRSGAEDFYLLNKLAKIGHIVFRPDITIAIEARLSDRVPFGTGPAVEKILQTPNGESSYAYYHPNCFLALRHLLQHIDYLFEEIAVNDANTILANEILANTLLESHEDLTQAIGQHIYNKLQTLPTLPQCPNINEAVYRGLLALDVKSFYLHALKQCRTQTGLIQHFHQWFDGFLTLKFIRYMQTHYFSDIALETCITTLAEYQEYL